MSKAVLISIRPEWCEKILSGKKTVEVRKTRPKLATPFKVYIYCTKSKTGFNKLDYAGHLDSRTAQWAGKVIAEFTCDFIHNIYSPCQGQDALDENMPGTAMTVRQYNDYCKIGDVYGWHIRDLKIYDQLVHIESFYKTCRYREHEDDDFICNGYGQIFCRMQKFDRNPDGSLNCIECGCGFRLSCPPQSWCYVEDPAE